MNDPMPHDPNYISSLARLVTAMRHHELPTPLSIGWTTPYGYDPVLWVQVQADDFRPWHDAMSGCTYRTEPVADANHVHAHGVLLHSPLMVHVVAVMHREAVQA